MLGPTLDICIPETLLHVSLKRQAEISADIRDLKQTDAAGERLRSTSKFLFRMTQGQMNSVGP